MEAFGLTGFRPLVDAWTSNRFPAMPSDYGQPGATRLALNPSRDVQESVR